MATNTRWLRRLARSAACSNAQGKRHTAALLGVSALRAAPMDPVAVAPPRKRRPWECGSLIAPDELPDDEGKDFIQHEFDMFVSKRPVQLSMVDFFDMLDPSRLAKFLHKEVLVRFAERLRWIEKIDGWESIPELAAVHEQHLDGFRDLRLVRRRPTLDAFTEVVQRTMDSLQDVPQDITSAMRRLHAERGDVCGSHFADKWCDKFFLNHIGTQTLMSQYLSCLRAQDEGAAGTVPSSFAGVIDPQCDPAQICREEAASVQDICNECTGRVPICTIEVHSASGDDKEGVPHFSYVPGFLRVIVREILKNSFRATAELVKTDRGLKKRPINIVVCADEHQVAIRITDRARGIPFDVGSRAWSYLYSTTGKGPDSGEVATELSGYGVGLPLSRLYARYLGGTLDLVSLPGYGTSVDIFLKRFCAEQIEVVPDDDVEE